MGRTETVTRPNVRLIIDEGRRKGQAIRFVGDRLLIGRDECCQLRPSSDVVSRRHAALVIQNGVLIARDLGSRNGTFVNGQPISEPTRLNDGDRLVVGPLNFRVSIQGGSSSDVPPAPEPEEVDSSERLSDVELVGSGEILAAELGASTGPPKDEIDDLSHYSDAAEPGVSAGPPKDEIDDLDPYSDAEIASWLDPQKD